MSARGRGRSNRSGRRGAASSSFSSSAANSAAAAGGGADADHAEHDPEANADGDGALPDPNANGASAPADLLDIDDPEVQNSMFEGMLHRIVRRRSAPAANVTLDDLDAAYKQLSAAIPRTGARRGALSFDVSNRVCVAAVSPAERRAAFAAFKDDCRRGNYTDFLDDVYRGADPHLYWSDNVPPEGDDAELGSDDAEEEAEAKRPRLSGSNGDGARSPASSSSSSSSSAPSTSPAKCPFSFENYMNMMEKADDMLAPCLEPSCSLLRKDHPRESRGDSSRFRMPDLKNFPKFRDPQDTLMADPTEFLIKLERQMRLFGVPEEKYGSLLLACLTDRQMQDAVENNILATNPKWSDVKSRFIEKYRDPELRNRLLLQLERCTQSTTERVYQYTERFQALATRSSGGTAVDTATNIVNCERGFIPAIREQLAKFRASESARLGSDKQFEFSTLQQLYSAAATCESGLAPRPGRVHAGGGAAGVARRRGGYARGGKAARVLNVQPVAEAPVINKIEMGEGGKPANMNKKRSFPSASANHRGRGGFGRGGVLRGRGGLGRAPSGPTSSGFSIRPGRDTVPRGPSAEPARKPFDGECYTCRKHGHRATECPNRSQ